MGEQLVRLGGMENLNWLGFCHFQTVERDVLSQDQKRKPQPIGGQGVFCNFPFLYGRAAGEVVRNGEPQLVGVLSLQDTLPICAESGSEEKTPTNWGSGGVLQFSVFVWESSW